MTNDLTNNEDQIMDKIYSTIPQYIPSDEELDEMYKEIALSEVTRLGIYNEIIDDEFCAAGFISRKPLIEDEREVSKVFNEQEVSYGM